MRTIMVAIGAVVLSFAGTTPAAHASPPGTLVARGLAEAKLVGNGVVVVATCGMTAHPDPGWYAALTTVWCDVNGFVSQTVTAPGSVAVVDMEDVTAAPVTLCVHGSAVFSPTLGPPQTATVDTCLDVPVD